LKLICRVPSDDKPISCSIPFNISSDPILFVPKEKGYQIQSSSFSGNSKNLVKKTAGL
jgi:hypothetical protein